MKSHDAELHRCTASMIRLVEQKASIDTIIHLLGVDRMGPADYIRTKHEVRDCLHSGDTRRMAAIVENAHRRCAEETQRKNRHKPGVS